ADLVDLARARQRGDRGGVDLGRGGQEAGMCIHGKLQRNVWSRFGMDSGRTDAPENAPSIGIIRTGTRDSLNPPKACALASTPARNQSIGLVFKWRARALRSAGRLQIEARTTR